MVSRAVAIEAIKNIKFHIIESSKYKPLEWEKEKEKKKFRYDGICYLPTDRPRHFRHWSPADISPQRRQYPIIIIIIIIIITCIKSTQAKIKRKIERKKKEKKNIICWYKKVKKEEKEKSHF